MDRAGMYERLTGAVCPRCGHNRIHRSHRKSMNDEWLAMVGLWPYRCVGCGLRFRSAPLLRWLGKRPWAGPDLKTVVRTATVGERQKLNEAARAGRILLAALATVGLATGVFLLILHGQALLAKMR